VKVNKLQLIAQIVNDSDIPLSPYTIHQQINKKVSIKYSTVRGYLRRLLEQSQILQPFKGYYCNKITHTLMNVPLRSHNLLFTIEKQKWIQKSEKIEETIGAANLMISFGNQRKKVTCQISCDKGLSLDACLFGVKRLLDIVESRKGSPVRQLTLRTFEVNRDFQGTRIDGAKCYTRTGLFGVIERIYQKDESTVRVEQKVSRRMKVDEFTALLQGGVQSYNLTQALFIMTKKMQILADALKFGNQKLFDLESKINDLIHRASS